MNSMKLFAILLVNVFIGCIGTDVYIIPKEIIYLNKISSLWTPNPWNSTWLATNPCAKWIGIKCDSEGHVISIDLRRRDMVGPIPSFLPQFDHLEIFTMSENFLQGTIPENIGTIKTLKVFDVFRNRLVGPIPQSITNLPLLEELTLGYNNLNGTIPDTIGNLRNLQTIYMNNNHLDGTIPTSIGRLTSLVDLELSYNNISGTIPPSIGTMTSLQRLTLRNNKLIGSIPEQIGNLDLITLHLSGNQLSGRIPTSIGNIYSLQVFVASGNFLTGKIPQIINLLPHLSGRSFGRNCLRYPDGWKGKYDKQRPMPRCRAFCFANSAEGPCAGRGSCSIMDGVATCICNAGYVVGKSPKTCVPASAGSTSNTILEDIDSNSYGF